MADQPGVTALLRLATEGDREALDRVFPVIYDELRALARSKRTVSAAGETLRTTALVNEAYLRLVGKSALDIQSRRHFFFLVSRAMHDLIVEEARKQSSLKKGGNLQRVELPELEQVLYQSPEEILALERALEKLKAEDSDDHDVVMLRFFSGLTMQEIADTLQVSTRTIERRWRFSKAWLARELA